MARSKHLNVSEAPKIKLTGSIAVPGLVLVSDTSLKSLDNFAL